MFQYHLWSLQILTWNECTMSVECRHYEGWWWHCGGGALWALLILMAQQKFDMNDMTWRNVLRHQDRTCDLRNIRFEALLWNFHTNPQNSSYQDLSPSFHKAWHLIEEQRNVSCVCNEGAIMLKKEESSKTWGTGRIDFDFMYPACWGSLCWGGGAVPTGLSPTALPLRVTVPTSRTESFTSTLRTEGSGADSGQSGSSW